VKRVTLAILSLTLLAGCATLPDASDALTSQATAAGERDALLASLGALPIGRSMPLKPGGALGGQRATVVDAYRAASERDCRRVRVDERSQHLICQTADGRWTLQRRISLIPPVAPAASITPVASTSPGSAPIEPVGAVVSVARVEVLGEGETLWSFAARTTGSGIHWSRIAAANGVNDASRVSAGTALTVPMELLSARPQPRASSGGAGGASTRP